MGFSLMSTAEQLKEYRRKNPGYRKRQYMLERARERARIALQRRYPSEYNKLYQYELAKLEKEARDAKGDS